MTCRPVLSWLLVHYLRWNVYLWSWRPSPSFPPCCVVYSRWLARSCSGIWASAPRSHATLSLSLAMFAICIYLENKHSPGNMNLWFVPMSKGDILFSPRLLRPDTRSPARICSLARPPSHSLCTFAASFDKSLALFVELVSFFLAWLFLVSLCVPSSIQVTNVRMFGFESLYLPNCTVEGANQCDQWNQEGKLKLYLIFSQFVEHTSPYVSSQCHPLCASNTDFLILEFWKMHKNRQFFAPVCLSRNSLFPLVTKYAIL